MNPVLASLEAVDADQFDDFARETGGDQHFFTDLQMSVPDLEFLDAAMEGWGFPLSDDGARWLELENNHRALVGGQELG